MHWLALALAALAAFVLGWVGRHAWDAWNASRKRPTNTPNHGPLDLVRVPYVEPRYVIEHIEPGGKGHRYPYKTDESDRAIKKWEELQHVGEKGLLTFYDSHHPAGHRGRIHRA